MVRADLLDQIDIVLRQTRRKRHLPFGGVQVLLIGDMYQLPPVVQRDEWKTAAKGGSIWHRALGAVKWFAIGAGTGAAAYAIAHHK